MEKSHTESETQPAQTEPEIDKTQLLKLAVETGPVIVFFIANVYADIFWATGIFMVATTIALVASRILFGRVPVMPLVSGVFILLFGALTLVFQEELFIKIKPTIVNLMFAAILFGGLFMGHSLIKYLLGEIYRLRDEGWRLLTFRWACFFVFLAILNEFVWRTFSTDFWISFKLWGVMPITMAFALSQIGILKQYEIADEDQRSGDA
ncbi:MAG: septation protein A [Pseudomonadota bacterium]